MKEKSYSYKQNLREFSTTKPALRKMLKELIQSINIRGVKDLQNQCQTIKKITIGTYVFLITLNGLNAPIKDTDWLNGYKNKTHIYTVYKTHID